MHRFLILVLSVGVPLPVALGQSSGSSAGSWRAFSSEAADSAADSSADPAADPAADPGSQASAEKRPISWGRLVPNTLQDQKAIYWDFPRSLSKGRHLLPTAICLAGIGALIATDQYESPYFRRTSTYQSFNNGFSSTNTSLMIAGVPAATYLVGLIRKGRYSKATALLTAEAIADSEVSTEILKVVTRRARPESIAKSGNFADTWQDARTVTGGGFPSGHTIAAFSVATILSRRYGQRHHWAPFVAYGLASTVGLSRLTLSAHNLSDVAAGASFGYMISRFVVLRN